MRNRSKTVSHANLGRGGGAAVRETCLNWLLFHAQFFFSFHFTAITRWILSTTNEFLGNIIRQVRGGGNAWQVVCGILLKKH